MLLVVGIMAGLGMWTGVSWVRGYQGGPAQSENAVRAVVTSCERQGPISRFGLGYWWNCEADIRGRSETARLNGSEVTPQDIGESVFISAKSVSNASPSTYYLRDVEHPMRWLTVPLVVVGIIVLLALGGSGLLRLLPQEIRLGVDEKLAAELRARYRAEGRF